MCQVLPVHPEEVVVVRGLGVQVSSTSWAGLSSSVFLPHTVVGDLVINEGITMVSICLTHQPQKRLLYLSLIPSLFSPTQVSGGVLSGCDSSAEKGRHRHTSTDPQTLPSLHSKPHSPNTFQATSLSTSLPLSSALNQYLFPLLLQLTFSLAPGIPPQIVHHSRMLPPPQRQSL